jgi:hypothetical protein
MLSRGRRADWIPCTGIGDEHSDRIEEEKEIKMKKITVLILLVLMMASAVLPVMALIGGAEDFEHTNVGAIVLELPNYDDKLGRLCSGTLIHPRVFLTAAHCFTKLEEFPIYDDVPLYVTFEQYPLADDPDPTQYPTRYIPVDYRILHPDLSRTDGPPDAAPDFALVFLKDPVPSEKEIEPQALPARGYMDRVVSKLDHRTGRQDLELTIVGYGVQSRDLDPHYFDAIRKVGTVWLTVLKSDYIDTRERDGAIWYGDSGGPIFHLDKHGDEVIVGLVGGKGDGVSHCRLDTDSVLDWIKDTIDAHIPIE